MTVSFYVLARRPVAGRVSRVVPASRKTDRRAPGAPAPPVEGMVNGVPRIVLPGSGPLAFFSLFMRGRSIDALRREGFMGVVADSGPHTWWPGSIPGRTQPCPAIRRPSAIRRASRRASIGPRRPRWKRSWRSTRRWTGSRARRRQVGLRGGSRNGQNPMPRESVCALREDPETGRVTVYLAASNGRTLATSEPYVNRAAASRGIDTLRRAATTQIFQDRPVRALMYENIDI